MVGVEAKFIGSDRIGRYIATGNIGIGISVKLHIGATLLIRSDNGKQAIPCCDITKALKVQTINSGRNVYVSFVAVRRCRSAEKITRRVATCHCQLVTGGSCKLFFSRQCQFGDYQQI